MFRRVIVWLVSALLMVALIAIIAIKVIAPRVIEKLAIEQIASLGVQSAALTVEEITLDRVVISGLRIGSDADLEIPDLRAEFSLRDLFSARMKEIHISGLVLRLKRVDEGLSFGALDPLFLTSSSSAQSNTVERWPVDTIVLDDSVIEIKSPFDTTYLPFAGRMTQTADRNIQLDDTRLEFIHPNLQLSMTVRGKMDVNGVLKASLDINEGLITFGAVEAVVEGGRFETSGRLEQISSFRAEGGFKIARTTLPLGFQPKVNYALSLENENLTSDIALDDSNRGVHATLNAVISNIFGSNPSISIDLKNTINSLRAMPPEAGLPGTLDGRALLDLGVAFDFEDFIRLTESSSTKALMDALPILNVRVRAEDVMLDDMPVKAGLSGNFSLQARGESIALRSRDGLEIVIAETEAGLFTGLLGPVAQSVDKGALQFTLQNDGDILVLSRQGDGEDIALHFAGQSTLVGSRLPDIQGHMAASLALNQNDFALNWFSLDKFFFAVDPMKLGDGVLSPDVLAMTMTGGPDWVAGNFDLQGSFNGAVPGGLDLKNARLQLKGDIDFADNRLSLSLDECGRIRAEAVRLSGIIGIDAPMHFCLENQSATGSLMTLELDNNGNPAKVHTEFRLIPEYANIDIQPRDGPGFQIRGDDRSIEVRSDFNLLTNVAQTRATLQGYDIVIPDYRLLVDDVAISTDVVSKGLDIESVLDLKIGSLIQAVKKPFIAPSSLDLHVELNQSDAHFNGKISIANNLAVIEVEGSHEILSGTGETLLRMLPLTLSPQERTLQALSPVTADWVDQIAGMAIGVGVVRWNKSPDKEGESDIAIETDVVIQGVAVRTNSVIVPGLAGEGEINIAQLGVNSTISLAAGRDKTGTMRLLLENAYFDTDAGRAERVNGVIDFSSLWPLATGTPQQLSIAQIGSGFPLTDGEIEFELDQEGVVDLHQVRFNLAGGTISVEGIQLGPNVPVIRIPLVIRDIDAAALADLIPVSGLGASGIIHGSIPIEVDGNDFYINEGVLAAAGGGVIFYRPENAEQTAASNEYMGLALDILNDFHYSDLLMKVEKPRGQDLVFHFVIKGANPAFYEGFPVELRLNVAGEIGKLIRNELTVYSIPELIKDRILRFGTP